MGKWDRSKPARLGPGPPGDLPPLKHSRGIVGVRKMAVGVLQQQLEYMRNRVLSEDERTFCIEVVKALVVGEKVTRAVVKDQGGGGAMLPPLESNAPSK